MNIMFKPGFAIIVLIIFIGCAQQSTELKSTSQRADSAALVKYARGFEIKDYTSFKYVMVRNPWVKGEVLASYIIGNSDKHSLQDTADFFIGNHMDKIAVLSSSSVGMMCLLNVRDLITSASDPELIFDSILYNRYKSGSITDLGETNRFNVEYIIDNEPGLVFKYIYGAPETEDILLKNAGIPIAYNLEFMETHPLGRAEWIKFIAAFVGKDEVADSIFSEIENNYYRISGLAKKQQKKPSVLDGSMYNGVWYSAGGASYQATLYRDAGADYYWEGNDETGSNAVSFEVILENQLETDFWIGASTGSRNDLLNIESRYELLKPFRENTIYYYGERVNPQGGMDYFESGVARPDIVLKDLISVFHPDLVDSTYKTVYISRVK